MQLLFLPELGLNSVLPPTGLGGSKTDGKFYTYRNRVLKMKGISFCNNTIDLNTMITVR